MTIYQLAISLPVTLPSTPDAGESSTNLLSTMLFITIPPNMDIVQLSIVGAYRFLNKKKSFLKMRKLF